VSARPEGLHAVTIDLDGAWCYRAIHGVVAAGDHGDGVFDDDDDAILAEGLPRFLDACTRLDVKATLFVVARDLGRPRFRLLVQQAIAAGHAVMSHSFSHRYDLASQSVERIVADLARARGLIADATGVVPPGFRAPGYTTSAALWQALVTTGHRWTSSVLPSPPYLAVKRAVRALTRLRGARSASQAGAWRAYSPLYARPPAPLVEMPVTTALGWPWLGTTIALLPDDAGAALTRLALTTTPRERLVFELHAADFADGRHLPPGQPDADVPLADKRRRIERTLRAIAAR
jgi:peptidoglycan/xylan/chitin deacetylase (PgdA/CDA1 family)